MNLRGGTVTRIRVNPKDCISVLDVIEAAGIPNNGMSFAQQVSLALASLLESARKAQLIPEPDTFEYLNRMQPYMGNARNGQKAVLSKHLNSMGALVQAPALPQSLPPSTTHHIHAEPVLSDEEQLERKELGRQLQTLLDKQELAERDKSVIWSVADQAEFDRLYGIIYGDC